MGSLGGVPSRVRGGDYEAVIERARETLEASGYAMPLYNLACCEALAAARRTRSPTFGSPSRGGRASVTSEARTPTRLAPRRAGVSRARRLAADLRGLADEADLVARQGLLGPLDRSDRPGHSWPGGAARRSPARRTMYLPCRMRVVLEQRLGRGYLDGVTRTRVRRPPRHDPQLACGDRQVVVGAADFRDQRIALPVDEDLEGVRSECGGLTTARRDGPARGQCSGRTIAS